MIKLPLRTKAIALTRDFSTNEHAVKSTGEASFCLDCCPHAICKGDCAELKAFKKSLKRGRKKK